MDFQLIKIYSSALIGMRMRSSVEMLIKSELLNAYEIK